MDAVDAVVPSQQAVGKMTNRLGLVTDPVGCGVLFGVLWVWLRVQSRLVDGCRRLQEGH